MKLKARGGVLLIRVVEEGEEEVEEENAAGDRDNQLRKHEFTGMSSAFKVGGATDSEVHSG
jgi:hypothetical protein